MAMQKNQQTELRITRKSGLVALPRGSWVMLALLVATSMILVLSLLKAIDVADLAGGGSPQSFAVAPLDQAQFVYLVDWDDGTADWNNVTDQTTVGRIRVYDSHSLSLIHEIHTGYDPQFALSPDRQQLYVAETVSRDGTPVDQLRVIDVATEWSTIATAPLIDRYLTTISVAAAVLVPSHDGHYLYALHSSVDGVDHWVTTYDTESNTFLGPRVQLPATCTMAEILPLATSTIAVACNGLAHSITLADPETGISTLVMLPDQPPTINGLQVGSSPEELAAAVASLDRQTIYAVTRGAMLYTIDVSTRTISGMNQLSVPPDWGVPYEDIAMSSDGGSLFVGFGSSYSLSRGMVDEVATYSVSTLDLVDSVSLSLPVLQFLVNEDDDLIYGIERREHRLIVFSQASGEQVASIPDIGLTPDRVLK
jgi:hypothetical protein